MRRRRPIRSRRTSSPAISSLATSSSPAISSRRTSSPVISSPAIPSSPATSSSPAIPSSSRRRGGSSRRTGTPEPRPSTATTRRSWRSSRGSLLLLWGLLWTLGGIALIAVSNVTGTITDNLGSELLRRDHQEHRDRRGGRPDHRHPAATVRARRVAAQVVGSHHRDPVRHPRHAARTRCCGWRRPERTPVSRRRRPATG